MHILFDIGHPAHVHLYRNFIKELVARGEKVTVTSRDKEVTNALLNHYGIEYINLSTPAPSKIGMGLELLSRDYQILKQHRKDPVSISFGTSVSIAHLSAVSGVPSIVSNEDDDDVVPLFTKLTYPFATQIINPVEIIFDKWTKKRKIVHSYHELAYLHPSNFKVKQDVCEKYGFKPGEFILYRASALRAHHDSGILGLNSLRSELSDLLDGYQVLSSDELSKSQFKPWELHQLLASAKFIITDSQTMSVEAAILGVPCLRFNSFADSCSIIKSLEDEYNLIKSFMPGRDNEDFLRMVKHYLNSDHLKKTNQVNREEMLHQKIDYNIVLNNIVNEF